MRNIRLLLTGCLLGVLGFAWPVASPGWAQTPGAVQPALQGGLDDPLGSLDAPTAAYQPSFFEPFNEKMFAFNIWMDERLVRPVARTYAAAVPEPFERRKIDWRSGLFL